VAVAFLDTIHTYPARAGGQAAAGRVETLRGILQSTNEELETTNEEVQSSIEEWRPQRRTPVTNEELETTTRNSSPATKNSKR